ncbi:putative auxin efflux carrier component 5 [Hibiscus syriacus]|uniref:Auxin efflux carrier component n=1 Tax=Hibiscus syriacus TaxID=106335 RepID=A0A6A2ZVV6_HIBSY|nr:putative auxin efflux carrier component 5 [Hibiscus syriacus]
MISLADVYHVVAATVPLYFAMILAYVSVKWMKLFTPEQCAGINKFVAKFSIPLLSFQVISENNPYKMNLKLILADFLQKLLAFLVLFAVTKLTSRGGLPSIITGLSLSTMPNTLILGIPLLRAMYGDMSATLLAQIVVLQSLIWYNLLLLLFELNATKASSETVAAASEGDEEHPEEEQGKEGGEDAAQTRAKKSKAKQIFMTVGKKLMTNPNTHATVLGLIWASFPAIVEKSIAILSSGGLGMAMFSLGLFMASRPSIIACGIRMAAVAMGMKFMAGPALMAAASTTLGLKGRLLRVAIVQAALPQGVVPFVFAKEYNIHPDILSTGVIFGMLIALPVALVYYLLLGF